jgi:replicative DNA helicase
MTEESDTLTKFGPSFQSKCLAGVLTDKGFLERIMDIVKLEFFENQAHQWILQTILDYFHDYKDLPTMDVFKHKLDSLDDDKALRASVIEHLRSVFTKQNDTDLQYIREQFLEFCVNQNLKSAIIESADLLRSGDYERIKHTVDEALKAGMERDDGHDYLNEIMERLENDCRNTVKTTWECVDNIMDGGLGAGELGVIGAPAGAGKSWALNKIGAEAMKQGKNVVHFTLELGQKYVGRRYDCCFTGIDFQQINKASEEPEITERVKASISNIRKNGGGWLKIKYFPIKTVSALSLKNYIERIQTLTGEKVDLMVVDYADILRPVSAEKNSNSYSEAGGIYEELRGVAGELQIPCWTASQTNRSSAQEDVIEAGSISDSFRKIMTADYVMSLSRKTDDKLQNTARFHVIKNRFGPDGGTYPAMFDASCGDIKIFEPSSSEGKQVYQKINNSGEAVKDCLRDALSKIQNNSEKDNDLG